MIKHMTKLTGWTASLVALAVTASADVKVNDYLSLNGYAAAAGTVADTDSGKSTSTLFNSGNPELDVIKVAAVGKYGDFGGKISLLYVPTRAGSNSGILDCYATYAKDEFTVTAGKFLSYLGYEAFDTNNMTQLTYGSTFFAIPAYHTGAKVDYAAKTWGAGFALVDSVYNPGASGWAPYAQGDGRFDRLGSEGYVSYTGIDKLTLWAGFAYDDNVATTNPLTLDAWASYALNAKTTLALEVDSQESVGKAYLAEVQYAFTDKFSGIARISAEDTSHGDTGSYYTIAPTYKITPAFSVRGEVSYADAAEGTAGAVIKSKGIFYGVQALFVF